MATSDFLLAGLGNPGRAYQGTPHNAGFDVVTRLADDVGVKLRRSWRFSARLAQASMDGVKVCFMQPLTYMNRSGDAVAPWLRYYRLEPRRMIVVVDDIDRPLGTLRIRGSGRSGGHNGLRSIVDRVGSEDFVRLRIGVGRGTSGNGDVVRHVLSPFSAEEGACYQRVLEQAGMAVRCLLTDGLAEAMNRFNGWRIEVADDRRSNDVRQGTVTKAKPCVGQDD